MMYYSFTCPFPCNYVIKVGAENSDDAVGKIMAAGAMSCRNLANRCYCEKKDLNLYPIPEDDLRNVVSLHMQVGN